MATSFYDLSVDTYKRVVGATVGVLEKGAAHCAENDISLDDVVATSLHPDMLSFHFQAVCVVHHSIGAIKGMQAGEFSPPSGYPDTDYAGLQSLVSDALADLEELDTLEVDRLAGGNVNFKIGDNEIPFSNENFVLSFSLPNLFFHATTAYDILRMKGAPIGKRDFLGQMRVG